MMLSLRLNSGLLYDSDSVAMDSVLDSLVDERTIKQFIRNTLLSRLPTYEVDCVTLINFEGCDKLLLQDLLFSLVKEVPLATIPLNKNSYVTAPIQPRIIIDVHYTQLSIDNTEPQLNTHIMADRDDGVEQVVVFFQIEKGIFRMLHSLPDGFTPAYQDITILGGEVEGLLVQGAIRYVPVKNTTPDTACSSSITQYNRPVVTVGYPRGEAIAKVELLAPCYKNTVEDVFDQLVKCVHGCRPITLSALKSACGFY